MRPEKVIVWDKRQPWADGTILGTALPFLPTVAPALAQANSSPSSTWGGRPDQSISLFVSGGAKGADNYYLFWGGDDLKPIQTGGETSAPEPGPLSLLGLGLVAVARKVRQRISA